MSNFTSEQCAEFAESYVVGINNARPTKDLCPIGGWCVSSIEASDDAGISAAHLLIER